MGRPITHGKYSKNYQNYCPKCNKKISPNSKFCASHSHLGKKNGFFGKHHTKMNKKLLKKIKIEYYKHNIHPNLKHGLSKTRNYYLEQSKKILLKKFDLTLEDYKRILDKQNNSCAICSNKNKPRNRRLSIDHNHKTGNFRGLLYNKCNFMIGLANESIVLFKKAIKYLKRN